jgi:hypothetical protein
MARKHCGVRRCLTPIFSRTFSTVLGRFGALRSLALALTVVSAPFASLSAQGSHAVRNSCLQARDQPFFAFQVSSPAVFLKAASDVPRPARSIDHSTVTVQFIVDTTGRVELGWVKGVLVGDSVLFRATIKGLSTWRFRPAVWNHCWHARQLVQVAVVGPHRKQPSTKRRK